MLCCACVTGSCSLLDLLPELHVLIASFLEEPEDVLAFRSVSRSIRSSLDQNGLVSLIALRWGPEAHPCLDRPSTAHLLRSFVALFNYRLPAEHLQGAWTDNERYYTRLPGFPGAESDQVLRLKYVFWLDVVGVFQVRPLTIRCSAELRLKAGDSLFLEACSCGSLQGAQEAQQRTFPLPSAVVQPYCTLPKSAGCANPASAHFI